MLGGSDDLLQLVADKQLHKLLEQAQGKAALPKELQDAVLTASTSLHASLEAAFMPDGISTDDYMYLQKLATDMATAGDNIQWWVLHLVLSARAYTPTLTQAPCIFAACKC